MNNDFPEIKEALKKAIPAAIKCLQDISSDESAEPKTRAKAAIVLTRFLRAKKKTGHWVGEFDGYADGAPVYDIWSCSECGTGFPEWDEKPTWNFCPECGADMREES